MIIRLLSINLWNYNHFDERLPKIISLIKELNPDIVAFQEVRDDSRRNKAGNNQLKQLNNRLAFKHLYFYEYMDVNKVNKALHNRYYDPDKPKVLEGLGLLSRYPIARTYSRHLKRHKDDRYPRGILCARIRAKTSFDIFVVHFSADDLFSRLHLQETLDYAKEKKIHPIIVGDFNIRKPHIAHELASAEYIISRDEYEYYSYPSKKETLDYVLIPKTMRYLSFKCIKTQASDHSLLFAEIEM